MLLDIGGKKSEIEAESDSDRLGTVPNDSYLLAAPRLNPYAAFWQKEVFKSNQV